MNLFLESFDWLTTLARLFEGKWTQTEAGIDATDAITSAAGGHGTQGLRLGTVANAAQHSSNSYTKVLAPADNRIILGFRFRTNSAFTNLQYGTTPDGVIGNTTFWRIRKSNATTLWFRPNASGTISVYRGTTLLGTTTNALAQGVQYYIEFNALVQTSGGEVTIRVDGVPWLSLTGVNTANAGTDGYDEIRSPRIAQTAAGVTWDLDDIYVNDGSGAVNNTFWGDTLVHGDTPTGDGDVSDWAPLGAGSNFSEVDDANPDDDTSYNETTNAGDSDLFTFPSWAAFGEVRAVQMSARVRKTDAGAATLKVLTKNGGTTTEGAEQGVPSSYGHLQQTWDVDPSTGSAWSPAASPQFGYRKAS